MTWLLAVALAYAVGRSGGIWRERGRFMDWQDNLQAYHDSQSGGQRRRSSDRKAKGGKA